MKLKVLSIVIGAALCTVSASAVPGKPLWSIGEADAKPDGSRNGKNGGTVAQALSFRVANLRHQRNLAVRADRGLFLPCKRGAEGTSSRGRSNNARRKG